MIIMSEETRKARLDRFNTNVDKFQDKVNEMAEIRELNIAAKKEYVKIKKDKAIADRDAAKASIDGHIEKRKAQVDCQVNKVRDAIDGQKEKIQAKKDARDQKKLEKYIDEQLDYAEDCFAVALYALEEAKVAFIEAVEATIEYEEKYGN